MADDDALIDRLLEADPFQPGPEDVRLVESGVPVWAVIGHLPSVDGDREQAAASNEVSREAMDAAVAYYRRYGSAIDARLTANPGGSIVKAIAV